MAMRVQVFHVESVMADQVHRLKDQENGADRGYSRSLFAYGSDGVIELVLFADSPDSLAVLQASIEVGVDAEAVFPAAAELPTPDEQPTTPIKAELVA